MPARLLAARSDLIAIKAGVASRAYHALEIPDGSMQMNALVARITALPQRLAQGLVEREREVRLVLLAALAGEHSLLIGAPGTAKSALARRLHAAFRDARYFERLLTRFSVPEELFGPLSISALEQDRYERHTAGFLPEASIAFIDEVFKANSAILNALLTLLNEREFDNGAGRMRCPLISVIGATNEVPDDEVAEAFFDRFLLRLTVSPVSAEGFSSLLACAAEQALSVPEALDASDLAALSEAAARVRLGDEVVGLLAELRTHLAADGQYVSDRRWVKIAQLLRVACASEARVRVEVWDLWLLPWCVAAEVDRQQAVEAWLETRLGVRAPVSPARITRVVEAFEAQLEAEKQANDLDYDESGRLRFSASELAGSIGDAKGGAQALRLTHSRRRRYGRRHIEARIDQIDEAGKRIDACAREIGEYAEGFGAYRRRSIWMDEAVASRIEATLTLTRDLIEALARRLATARAGFAGLPQLPDDPGVEPARIVTDSLTD